MASNGARVSMLSMLHSGYEPKNFSNGLVWFEKRLSDG
jgi:hypothetical protein